MLSINQIEKGLKREQETYIVTLIETKKEQSVEVSDVVVIILEEFNNMMFAKLPMELPFRQPTNHMIELLPSTKPPTQVLYRMSLTKLLELKK